MSSDSGLPDRQKAKTFFQYGNDATLKSNLDYAIDMFKQACKLAPDNLSYRQALRGAQRRKFNNDPSKVGRLVGARNQPIRMRARSARSKGKYAHVLEICEDAFTHNPWDVAAAREASEAAEQLGFLLLAEWYVESVQAQAKDADFFRHAAHVHERNEHWHKAIASWEQVKLLTVAVDRLKRWYRRGLLCIGDAAHAMSPVGGVGINLAVQDAVAAANILAAPLYAGMVGEADLARVQERRAFPTRMIQGGQVFIQKRVISGVLGNKTELTPPLPVRLMQAFPILRRIPARIIGLGVRPEHIQTPERAAPLS